MIWENQVNPPHLSGFVPKFNAMPPTHLALPQLATRDIAREIFGRRPPSAPPLAQASAKGKWKRQTHTRPSPLFSNRGNKKKSLGENNSHQPLYFVPKSQISHDTCGSRTTSSRGHSLRKAKHLCGGRDIFKATPGHTPHHTTPAHISHSSPGTLPCALAKPLGAKLTGTAPEARLLPSLLLANPHS